MRLVFICHRREADFGATKLTEALHQNLIERSDGTHNRKSLEVGEGICVPLHLLNPSFATTSLRLLSYVELIRALFPQVITAVKEDGTPKGVVLQRRRPKSPLRSGAKSINSTTDLE
jgi:hypothetical protein